MERKTKSVTLNGVKGTSQKGGSAGRNGHVVGQVVSDRNRATALYILRNRKKINIATWNVNTLYQPGKLNNVKQEARKFDIDILGVFETR